MAQIEVDPYEAIVLLALTDSDLQGEVSNRIDVWHHYGQEANNWNAAAGEADKSLVFVPSGGELNLDVGFSKPTFEARCYADTPFECGEIWKALVAFTVEHNEARTVSVTQGTALVKFVLPASGQGMPGLRFDEDVRPNGGLPFYSILLQAEVSNLTVT